MTRRLLSARGGGRRVAARLLLLAPALFANGAPAGAQTLAQRIDAAPDGQVRLSFDARPGVCGDGRGSVWTGDRNWEPGCDPGPVRVALEVRDGRVREVESYLGGRWLPAARATDLGAVPPAEAAAFLLGLAREAPASVGEDAIFPATIAAGPPVWPELLAIARDRTAPGDTREQATFWVGQAAAEEVTSDLSTLAQDGDVELEIREAAVFALSQRPEEEGVPALIDIVREHRDPRIRAKSLFWLGESGDPRALALFEEILVAR